MRNCRGGATGIATAILACAAIPCLAAISGQSIYTEKLQNGWQPWGWAAINYNNAHPAHSGHKSIAVTVKKGWDALYVHHDAFNTRGFRAVSFWIDGGAKGGQVLQVQATVNKKPVKSYKLPALAANRWTHVTVPLSALAVANKSGVDGFWIQDGTGKPLPTFYVDDFALVK